MWSDSVEEDEYLSEETETFVNIPEHILLQIFLYLDIEDIINASYSCKRWYFIAHDDYLWMKCFQKDFKIEKNISRKPGSSSWIDEYKRLTSKVPMVLTEILESHSHQVLHVSFSNNGKMFATCSKDALIIVWDSVYPASEKYSHDMKQLSWKYTQFSQFNSSDTLLLVSGVHFGHPHSTSGEIAVFSVQNEFQLRCRVVNRPYDVFGTWFTDQHLISGDLRWLAHLVSTSMLWLNKANQEVSSEHVPIMHELFKFYNKNASSLRAVTIANCPWLDENDGTSESSPSSSQDTRKSEPSTSASRQTGNPISHVRLASSNIGVNYANNHSDYLNQPSTSSSHSGKSDYARPINYSEEFRKEYEDSSQKDDEDEDDDDDNDDEEEKAEESFDDDDELENTCSKYLIFSTGSKTYTPHQIGIKRIGKLNLPRRLDPGPSLQERIALRNLLREQEVIVNSLSPAEVAHQFHRFQNIAPRVEPNWANYESVQDRFDKIDKLIDLDGHIIGMALSPDHKYLYVNSRPWPKTAVIKNPLEPPPIAQEIDIHVIDLTTLKQVGKMLRAHRAYTPNTECFFIFLNVCDNYVSSGAEDKFAYLWDRYYGVCLAQYQHTDVVNSVAFNPKDNEMLVTTSDDYKIKVWRSRDVVKRMNFEKLDNAIEIRRKKK